MVEPYKSVGKVVLLINRDPDVALPRWGTRFPPCVTLVPHLKSIDAPEVLGRPVVPKQDTALISKQLSYEFFIHQSRAWLIHWDGHSSE